MALQRKVPVSQGVAVGVCIRGISDIQCRSVHGVLGGTWGLSDQLLIFHFLLESRENCLEHEMYFPAVSGRANIKKEHALNFSR